MNVCNSIYLDFLLNLFWLPVYLHLFLSSYFVSSICPVSSVNFIFPLGLFLEWNLYPLDFSLKENSFVLNFSFCLKVSFFILVFDGFSGYKIFIWLIFSAHCNYYSTIFCLLFYYWALFAPLYLFCLFSPDVFTTFFMSLLFLVSLWCV